MMARQRVRAAARKVLERERHKDAWIIGSGVMSIAIDLEGVRTVLPVFVTAPLVYVCEMVAARICERESWPEERLDHVAKYLMAGLQEFMVALVERFDVEHFEAWTTADQASGGAA